MTNTAQNAMQVVVDTSQVKTRNETREDGELTDPIHATV
jgi:hypothetical protein